MFTLNDDLSIYATRGDIVFFTVSAEDKGEVHKFLAGDVVRIKIYGKKDAESVVLEKCFPVTKDTEEVEIYLSKEDTKFGEVISKPRDYWYEIELNPFTRPQTIIGYDEDGAKVFKLYPEGADIPPEEITPEDIPVVDDALDMTSHRPVENQAVAREIVSLRAAFDETKEDITEKSNKTATETANAKSAIAVERARIDNLVSGATASGSEVVDVRVGADGKTYASAGTAVREQTKKLTKGRYGMAILLPSSDGNYPSISTTEKTFTMGSDTLIINDRLPNGWVSLNASSGNDTVTWGSDVTSSAICFYYDIDGNKLVARNYSDSVVNLNYILLATLRYRVGANSIKSQVVCSCPVYVDGELSTETGIRATCFAAMLPPLDADGKQTFPKISKTKKTFVVPYDTLIVDSRLQRGYVSLKAETGNASVDFSHLGTSAICIYYDIEKNVLVAKAYNETVSPLDYLLLCTIRYSDTADLLMAYACCPVWLDNRLSTEVIGNDVPENDNIKSVNHRGYCTVAPENTLAAYRLSKANGFTHVECDVSFTSDGYAVLLHDDTVDRTSNGTGNIANMTLNQVRGLDFGSWKSSAYAGEKIPTFEEFIVLCKRLGLHPYIELKMGTETQIKSLVNTVKRYGMKGNVTWISFSDNFLVWVKEVDAWARLGYVVGGVNETTINTVEQKLLSGNNEVFIDCAYGSATADSAKLCADADIPLEVWTINNEAAILALDPYVSGFTSDNIVASRVMYEATINE